MASRMIWRCTREDAGEYRNYKQGYYIPAKNQGEALAEMAKKFPSERSFSCTYWCTEGERDSNTSFVKGKVYGFGYKRLFISKVTEHYITCTLNQLPGCKPFRVQKRVDVNQKCEYVRFTVGSSEEEVFAKEIWGGSDGNI